MLWFENINVICIVRVEGRVINIVMLFNVCWLTEILLNEFKYNLEVSCVCLQCIYRLFNILKQSSDLRNVALQVITLLMHYSWKSLEGLNMSKHCFQSSEVCSYPIQEK